MSSSANRVAVLAFLTMSCLSISVLAQDTVEVDPCMPSDQTPDGVATRLECIQLPDPALVGATNFVPTVVLGGVAVIGALLAGSNGPASTPSTP